MSLKHEPKMFVAKSWARCSEGPRTKGCAKEGRTQQRGDTACIGHNEPAASAPPSANLLSRRAQLTAGDLRANLAVWNFPEPVVSGVWGTCPMCASLSIRVRALFTAAAVNIGVLRRTPAARQRAPTSCCISEHTPLPRCLSCNALLSRKISRPLPAATISYHSAIASWTTVTLD
jgi:hypothetical protein